MENKFEKDVHQKLDELKITPSESVWLSVKARIRTKRDRKWPLITLVFLAFLLAAGYYFLSTQTENTLTSTSPSEIIRDVDKPKSDPNSVENKDHFQAQTDRKVGGSSESDLQESGTTERNQIIANDEERTFADRSTSLALDPQNSVASADSKKNILRKSHSQGKPTQPSTAVPEPGSRQTSSQDISVAEDFNLGKQSGILPMQTYLDQLPDIEIYKAESLNASSVGGIKYPTPSEKAMVDIALTPKDVDDNAKKKWSVGFYAGAGITHVGNRFLGLGPAVSADLLNSQNLNNSGGGPYFSASKVRLDLGYAAGVFLEKEILKSSSISFGMNFKELNTSNFVGRKNDSTALGTPTAYVDARNSSVTQQYRNTFRFIELPLQFNTQILNSGRFGILGTGGITISQMVSSDALQFNTVQGNYYYDNSLLNKTQIGIYTALSAIVIRNQNLSIVTGPFLNYHVSRIANEGIYNKAHFVFAGLQTRIVFQKK